MTFDSIQRVKNIAATMLLLVLLLVVGSNANPLEPRCGEYEFFDRVAHICTNCDEICDPGRGTSYLCEEYADECGPRKYRESHSHV